MTFVIEKPDNFKFIHRILNTNIDGKIQIPFALRGIRGIGIRFAMIICKIARVNPKLRAGELTEEQCQKVAEIIANPLDYKIPKWFLNRQYDYLDGKYYQLASNNLDSKIREDLERLKKIRSHRGLRHFWGLKVRGQHTKTTGRKGVTVGVTKKK